jgi:ATP-binding cassette, subfamily B, bacterial
VQPGDGAGLARRYVGPHWPRLALLAALLVVSTVLQVANPQLLRLFIDTALEQARGAGSGAVAGEGAAAGDGDTLLYAALGFLGIGLANQLLSAYATYVSNDVGWRATNRLRADLALHCLRLDMPFHNARTPGEMIERIDGDVTTLANLFSAFAVRVLGSALLFVGVLVMLWWESWLTGLLLGLFAVATFFLVRRVQHVAVPAARAEREASARLFGFLEERLSGIDDVRANGAGAYVMRRYYEANRLLFHSGRRSWLLRGVMWVTVMGLFALANALALALGYRQFTLGAASVGTVYLIAHYAEMLLEPLERVTRELQDLQRATASLGRVQELLSQRSQLPDGNGQALPPGALDVELDRVTFVYPDAPQTASDSSGTADASADGEAVAGAVLRDVSLRLEAGRTLGLLGRTGSGKTTLTRLLFRLYDPTEGTVRIGGVDARRPALEALRERVAVVTQDVQLFSGTVRDNLTLFDPGVPDERIVAVLEDLGLLEWLRALPEGLDTLLGPGGRGLSAGEAQLLAFTRAFLADPGLVVLDEASSRLDPATERLIERAVDKLLRGRTGVIIAHRLSTVQRADEILVLDRGRVREHGDRAALATNPTSRYAELLRTGLQEVLV